LSSGEELKIRYRDYAFLLLIAGVVVALDQWTKWLVRENLPFQSTWLPPGLDWLQPYARIVHWHNRGAAFGMFQEAWVIFTVLAVVVIAAILFYFPRVPVEDWTLRLALGLQLGGASGNLIDRLVHEGRVTDFISVGTFPVFNIADSSISVGVVVLLLGVWWNDRQNARGKGVTQPVDEMRGYE
jgi:signal peptidase II